VVGPELSKQGIRLVSYTGVQFLVDKIFRKLKDEAKPGYFDKIEARHKIEIRLSRE
jgi:hypothetical protein